MPSFAVTDKQLVDSINFVNSGPITNGQESKGFWYSSGGYMLWQNTYPPYFVKTTAPTPPTPPVVVPIPDGTYFRSPAYVFVKTTSTTDSVFVTAQQRPFIKFSYTDPLSDFRLRISIYRYLVDDTQPGWYISGEKLINFKEIAVDNNAFDATTPAGVKAGSASIGETVFCSIVDNPGMGYWLYSMEYYYEIITGDPVLEYVYAENIGLTATVIKI